MRVPLLAAFALLAPMLAGCSGPATQEPAQDTATFSPPGPAVAGNLTAPTWQKGQWWDHQWSLLENGNVTFQFIVRTVVAEDLGDAWTLATDNRTNAAFHGAFGFPTLGRISKGETMAQESDGGRWPWYRFPLRANATYGETVATLDGTGTLQTFPVVVRVTDGAAVGGSPGTLVVEVLREGVPYARYDYEPATGWFTDMFIFDDEGRPFLRIQRLAKGTGFQGATYDDTGDFLGETFHFIYPGGTAGSPALTFTMPDGNTHLLAFLFAFSATGASDAELVDPDGTRYNAAAFDINGQAVINESRALLAPAVPGGWTFATAGGGVAAGGGILAFAIKERAIQV